jgi:4-hydroxy-2-oxoheptanedioate aldolase
MTKNLMKAKISGGQAVAGVVMAESSIETLEVLALCGFDFIFIDCEHGPMSVESVSRMAMAAERRGITALLRTPENAESTILRYMDTGIGGIIIPGLDSREAAEKAVQAVKYNPEGRRGLAGVRAADYGLSQSLAEYVKSANQESMVIGVVESLQGVENIREMLEVEGLDGVFMGTNDLANSLGLTGQTSHPEILQAVDRIVAAGLATGKAIGGVVRAGENPQQYIDKGCKMVLTASQALLASASKDFLSKIENRKV